MKKIMIVDDDRNICELLRLYIEKEGFETAIANDGKAAVQMFDSVNPDLMLLDIMLPELDGWQVESTAKTVLQKLGIGDYTAKAGRSAARSAKSPSALLLC